MKQIKEAEFYVYIHRRADTGVPFYVGKGQGRRAWVAYCRNKFWNHVMAKHGLLVQIVERGLGESEAFELECALIELCGRTTLTNQTLGGEGAAGCEMMKESNGRPKRREQQRQTALRKWSDPMARETQAHLTAASWIAPESEARRAALRKANGTPESRERSRLRMIALWERPEFRAKVSATMKARAEAKRKERA